MEPFDPIASTTLSVTGTSASVALPGDTQNIRIANAGASSCFIAFGNSAVTVAADGTGIFMPAGSVEIFNRQPTDTHLAAICPNSATATLYITNGRGE